MGLSTPPLKVKQTIQSFWAFVTAPQKNNGAISTANSNCKKYHTRWVENMTPALPVQAKSDLKYPTGFLMACWPLESIGNGKQKQEKKQTSSLNLSKSYVSWTWQRSYFVYPPRNT